MTDDDPMAGKVSFDDTYDQPDPRAYFRTLATLDYQIPARARDPFAFLARIIRDRTGGDRASVLDLCCSYGVNAALLNHDVTLGDLYARYAAAELDELSSDELIAADRAYFSARRRQVLPVVGIDAASKAVDYALRAGLLRAGSGADLESDDPDEDLARDLADVGLVTVTGGIGYITEVTFDRLLTAIPGRPWIAAFSLRWVDMGPIGATLERHGYTLELLPGHTFRQRRFAGDDERDHAVARLHELGLDPDGVETDGYHHAAFYLARPHDEAAKVPVEELLAPVL